jgi:hypothetical protein
VLDLRIARLETIKDSQFARISAGLFHDAFEDAEFESDHQCRIPRFQLPDASKIWRDDLQITMNRGSAMSFAPTAAVNCDRGSDMEGNYHPWRAKEFNYSGLV